MAKTNYCDPSATYDGDGTTSAQAASNGAVGAWNSLRKVFTDTVTYGSLDVGDEVIIRSYNGADITVVDNSALTIPTGFTYRIDDGTVWPTGGTLTWQQTTGNIDIINNGSAIIAGFDAATSEPKMVFECTSNTRNDQWYWVNGGYHEGVWFKGPDALTTGTLGVNFANISAYMVNCRFQSMSTSANGFQITLAEGAYTTLINPIFDFKNRTNATPAISGNARSAGISIYGGKAINETVYNKMFYNRNGDSTDGVYGANYRCDCFDFGVIDKTVSIAGGIQFTESVAHNGSSFFSCSGGYRQWEPGLNYPTCTAIDLNGDPWSYLCLPMASTSLPRPLRINRLQKYYTSAAATLTLTLEMCIKDTVGASGAFDSMLNRDCIGIFTYTDATTGDKYTVTTPFVMVALPTSYATWIPEVGGFPVYGANNYNKHKLSVTTPTTVKQNTWIDCEVLFMRPRVYSDDFLFVDPEFQIA